MKIKQLYLFIISFIVFSCSGQTSTNVKTIDVTSYSEKIKATPNAQILDVRTPDEYAKGHIENSDNVDFLSSTFVLKTDKYDKTKPVFVYCKSGGRSAKASAKLAELGFTSIYNLDGGMLKWEAAGLAKPDTKIIGICSQEYAELLKSDKKIVVNFYAPWCAPCKKMEPYILKMQKEMADKVTIIRLNADENKTIMQELKISELPTLLSYEKQAVKWQKSGFVSEEELKTQLQ
ncbi:rhodanese-like domain-containing protein [Flavobacterium sp. HJJ]|uniref:rhodanese-like domain-containing protein n=1 Tax=Flavobacterium sp. HJJ TaxID=2783792 RepID=UPI00188B37B6|nr:rhodanese-like domain-containing protein [Flavobacterium sp. HJJ]MBF4470392.1 thioredoxin fold domain-containing protein [Flavobacterium sp. HJJ]